MDMTRMRPVKARVAPKNHTNDMGGPLELKIGVTQQPECIKKWDTKKKPLFLIEQPNSEQDNLTIIRVLFLNSGQRPDILQDSTMHKANVWRVERMKCPEFTDPNMTAEEAAQYKEAWKRMSPSTLSVYLKARYVDALPHPVPLGSWIGTVVDDEEGHWALFTLQAVTLAVKPVEEKRNILLPGDEAFESTRNYQAIVP